MKFSRLSITAFILISSLFFTACIKDEYPAKGVLVGYDPRDCACCGGFFINLDNNMTFNPNTKVTGSLPAEFIFDPSEFPLKVQFAWTTGGGCLIDNIVVTKIKRR